MREMPCIVVKYKLQQATTGVYKFGATNENYRNCRIS